MDRPEGAPSSIDPELLADAARLGLVADGLSERDLRLRLQRLDPDGAEVRARFWARENAETIQAYNERIARRGSFGDQFRRW